MVFLDFGCWAEDWLLMQPQSSTFDVLVASLCAAVDCFVDSGQVTFAGMVRPVATYAYS